MSFSIRLRLIPSAGGYDVMCAVRARSAKPLGDIQPYIQPYIRPYIQPYIRSIAFYVNNVVVATLQLGKNVSHDPIIGIHLSTLKPHDEVSIIWTDSESESGSAKALVT